MVVYGPIHTIYICWVLPSGGLVCTERDKESEAQVRELAEHLSTVIFFYSDDYLEEE